MADKQVTPFQLTDQFTMENFNQRIEETNTALAKKAESDLSNVSNETMKAKIESSGFSGGILPRVIVYAPTGSTVTCTKGETVLTAQEVEKTWTFDVPEYGDWTVSDGEYSNTVSVDSVKIYHVTAYEQLVNYTMLYDNGDQCINVSGGWGQDMTITPAYKLKQEMTLDSTSIKGSYSSQANPIAYIATIGQILLAGYNKIAVYMDFSGNLPESTAGNGVFATFMNSLTFNAGVTSDCVFINHADMTTAFSGLKVCDISETEARYLMIRLTYEWSYSATASVSIHGVLLTKQDDYATLAKKAGITASSIDDVLSASETLLSNKSAVNYMIYNCTGDFMVSAIQSSTFLTALNSSPYKELVYANEHWAKFLAMVA